MEKSIFTREYKTFLTHLRAVRERAGLTQEDLADRLNETQSFVSKCERGERRLDLIEVRAVCQAMGVSFPKFAAELEIQLSNG